MLSSVLRSGRAIQVNIVIMRAFVRLREILDTHQDLARKLDALEKKYEKHDRQIKAIFDAIRKLIEAPATSPRRRIGFLGNSAREPLTTYPPRRSNSNGSRPIPCARARAKCRLRTSLE